MYDRTYVGSSTVAKDENLHALRSRLVQLKGLNRTEVRLPYRGPMFLLQPFKGEIDVGIGIDIDVDIDSSWMWHCYL